MKLAVVGQGFVGKAYADWLEREGHDVIRYGLEPAWKGNAGRVAECDLVIVAVPTPTTLIGQDTRAIAGALRLAKTGAKVVIKSTVLPGTTDALQAANEHLTILHAPEFLEARNAAHDAAHPKRVVIGVPESRRDRFNEVARVIEVLPQSDHLMVVSARTAEFIKYAANAMLLSKVVVANVLFDASARLGADWSEVEDALGADPRIGPSHLSPFRDGGRGAGGPCFIKDFAALNMAVEDDLLMALEDRNIRLLRDSMKDTDLLDAVYGTEVEVAA